VSLPRDSEQVLYPVLAAGQPESWRAARLYRYDVHSSPPVGDALQVVSLLAVVILGLGRSPGLAARSRSAHCQGLRWPKLVTLMSSPVFTQRLGGAAMFAAATVAWFTAGFGWLPFVLLLFAFDLFMLGYLAGP